MSLKKNISLINPGLIEGRINSAALNDSIPVEIGLPMADQVDFFNGQFPLIWLQK